MFWTTPRVIPDSRMNEKRLGHTLSALARTNRFVLDPWTAKAWVFALVGERPVGCVGFYPPHATSLWVHEKWQGRVHAADMLAVLAGDVFRRFKDVPFIEAWVVKAHTLTAKAFVDAGWRREDAVPRADGDGKFLIYRIARP